MVPGTVGTVFGIRRIKTSFTCKSTERTIKKICLKHGSESGSSLIHAKVVKSHCFNKTIKYRYGMQVNLHFFENKLFLQFFTATF
jgi:hypothetical protein